MEETDLLKLNDDELEKVWMDGFQKWMNESRQSNNVANDYEGQQLIYSRFAKIYDKAIEIEKYSGPKRISDVIASLYPNNLKINVLDYGCGTGLVADFMSKKGYCNIDGLDCNQDLLSVTASKKKSRHLFKGSNSDGIEIIADKLYDVICSTGVFFLSSSHPGTGCIKDLCRIIKPGGFLIILTKVEYLGFSFVDMSVIDQLEHDGILKKIKEEKFEGYRQPFQFEKDLHSMGVIFMYQISS